MTDKTPSLIQKDSFFSPLILKSTQVRNEKFPLYQFDELPDYLQDNDFIRSGYRAKYSLGQVWMSLFRLHNETGNIWTHALTFLAFLGLFLYSSLRPMAQPTWDRIIVSTFVFLGCITFLFSSLFHLHICHSKKLFIVFGCLDYTGISALIAGSCMSITYFLWYCSSHFQLMWCCLILVANTIGIIGPFFPWWTGPRFRIGRAVIFISSVIVSAGGIFHYLIVHGTQGLPPSQEYFAVPGMLVMICLYLGGACIYMTRFPECLSPGSFDYLFHSHQFWHICVTMAACFHYSSILSLMDWRLQNQTCFF